MVTLKRLSVEDGEDRCPLLAQVESEEASPPSHHPQHKKPDSRELFLSRTNNLALSLVLLVGCYSAILIPEFLPVNQFTFTEDNQQPRDPALLNRSASLLSGPCQSGWCLSRLRPLACSPGLQDIPVFLKQAHMSVPWDQAPPLGLQGSEEPLAQALASLPSPGLPADLGGSGGEGGCKRCVVVGSGGVLHGSHLGSHIDQYDIIIRMNNAPVSGFEQDAGTRTTVRLLYPEGAPHSSREYLHTPLVALVVFKSLDLEWLTSITTKQPLSFWSKLWFWREVVEDIPLGPENFQILNPEILHRTGQALQSFAKQQRTMVPTLGASAVVMALQLCDMVSLAGFGYDLQQPGARLHYYESLRMDAIKAQVVHDVSAEKLFLRELVAAGVVTDLTGAL